MQTKAMRLIGTKDTPVPPLLIALVMRAGITFTLETWSYRWWFCPFCGTRLPSNGATSPYRAGCVDCGETVNCTREDCVPYIARSEPWIPPEVAE